MNLSGNTILVTGGASGIGLALVKRFVDRGSEVIICGRRADRLEQVRSEIPKVHTRVADVANADARAKLFQSVTKEFPAVNVLVNNAGIQRRIDLTAGEDWGSTRSEIEINLDA